MRVNYVLLLVATTLACANGIPLGIGHHKRLTHKRQLVPSAQVDSNPRLTNEDENSARYLKDSYKTPQGGADDEERGGTPSKLKAMTKYLQNKLGAIYLKQVEAYWAKHSNLRTQANM